MRGVGAGAAVAATGCRSVPTAPNRSDAAVAILEPTATSFVVAAWARQARTARIAVQRAGKLVRSAALALAESGSGHAVIDGLAAGTEYTITVTTADGIRLAHRARTSPHADDPRPVSIAMLADVDPSPAFDSDLVAHLVAASPDLLVSLGDFPYCDNGPDVAHTLAAYRDRHSEVRTLPKVRKLLESVAIRGIYDDHEFRNDWDAAAMRAEPARYHAAMTAWDEFFPVPGAVGDVRYRSWRWGASVECFLLDCRRFRGAGTMLGATQRAWLVERIRRSSASFKLVFTSVPLDFGNGLDHWSGFLAERDALFEAVLGIPGILFVSADQHWFAAHRHTYGIREFQVGPLARGIGIPPAPQPGVLFRAERYNVGLIEIARGRLTFVGLGAGGDRFYRETFTPDQLRPRRGDTV